MSAAAVPNIEANFTAGFGNASGGFELTVDLKLPGSGITAIFGASGSGKTTLLRCIAGLHKVPVGRLNVNGCAWQDPSHSLSVHKRPVGFVFQDANLFAHLTAQQNLNYALKRCKNAAMQQRYQRLVDLLALQPILQQYPAQLSGGERQRVAIARALLIDPQLLLMDEPLASLDEPRKQEVLPYLQKLRQEFELPILYVSHSVDEVARLADYLVVLEQGRVVAQGPLVEMLTHLNLPARPGGEVGVVIPATVAARDAQWHLLRLAFSGGELWVRDGGEALGESIRVRILASDVSLALSTAQDSSIVNQMPAVVLEVANDADAAMALVRVEIGSTVVISRITRRSVAHLQLVAGMNVWAQIKSVAVVR